MKTPHSIAATPNPARTVLILSLAPAIGLGIGRFAYSLVLPDMRDSLHWSYSTAGFMNTVNAAGYLAGALGGAAFGRRFGLFKTLWFGVLMSIVSLILCALTGNFLVLSFARILVGVEDGPFIIYRRHRLVSWLSDQIYHNRPYDEVVRELITSEGIWTTRPEVNFITVTVDQNNKEKGPDEKKLASRVCRAFLGIRIDCVQCHNDRFGGPWKQKDFHQLAAFFARAKMSMTGVRDNPDKQYEYRYLGQTGQELAVGARLRPLGGRRSRAFPW